MGMDQYLLIPFLGGWTSIYQIFWCSPGVQGFDTLPYIYIYVCVYLFVHLLICLFIWSKNVLGMGRMIQRCSSEFQDPNIELLYHIFSHRNWGYLPLGLRFGTFILRTWNAYWFLVVMGILKGYEWEKNGISKMNIHGRGYHGIYLSINLPTYLSIYLSYLSIYLIYLSIYLSIYIYWTSMSMEFVFQYWLFSWSCLDLWWAGKSSLARR